MTLRTISSTNDVVVRKSEAFKKKSIPAIMKVLCQLEDLSFEEWNQELEENVVSKNDPQSQAQDSLSQFSGSLGSKFMLLNCFPFIKEMIVSNEWKVKYSGLMALGVLAEGSSKYFKNDLDSIMSMVLPCFDHPEPRVIYATLSAVALLCDEFTPTLQQKYHEIIMANIIKYMKYENSIKVQCRAVSSIINFCKGNKITLTRFLFKSLS